MSQDCLVKKYKGSVSGDLPYYDAVRLYVDSAAASACTDAERRFNINSWEANKLSLKNIGGSFLDANGQSIGNEILINKAGGDNLIYYSANTTMILVIGKYYIKDLFLSWSSTSREIVTVAFEDLEGCTRLRQLSSPNPNQKGNIKHINSTELLNLYLDNTQVTGDICNLANCPISLISLTGSTTVYGDFASWAAVKTEPKNVTYVCSVGSVSNVKMKGVTLETSGTYTLAFDGQGDFTYTKQ